MNFVIIIENNYQKVGVFAIKYDYIKFNSISYTILNLILFAKFNFVFLTFNQFYVDKILTLMQPINVKNSRNF